MNEWETFCLRPQILLSRGARDQGERVGKMVKAAIYILPFPPWGESPHELDSLKLDDVSAVCGDSSLFFTPPSPNVLLETQRPLSVLATPSSQSSTCCSDACSDVALNRRTCLSFTAFVSAVSQMLLQYYISGSLSLLRLCLAWNMLLLWLVLFCSILNICLFSTI